MMIKRNRCRDTPRCCQGFTARSSDRDLVRGLHQGQRSLVTASTGRTHDRTPQNQQKLKSNLAQTEPSTHDNTLVADLDTPLMQQVLDVFRCQREADVDITARLMISGLVLK
jgi:hypothetical protein